MAKKRRDRAEVTPTSNWAAAREYLPNLRVLGLGVAAGVFIGLAMAALSQGWFARTVQSAPFPDIGATHVNSVQPPTTAPEGMVWIPGGVFTMGSSTREFRDAAPVHRVAVDGFWMDRTEVTNAQFDAFVKATDYVTVAEKALDPQLYPKVDPKKLAPASIVFTAPDEKVDPNRPGNELKWWKLVHGADWRHPEGPASDLKGREQYPVVHVAYVDAVAYAAWAKKRLPTEAEWEFAARGGLDGKALCWGDEFAPDGKMLANTWNGEFPNSNTLADGYLGAAPVASYPPNGFGLYDMAGNVWEWCSDWYHPRYYEFSPERNPQGPRASFDPSEPNLPKRVQRGGSYLCCDNYCKRYQPGSRGKGDPNSSTNHVGFRCVR
jgi:sulfatase modifying factor 1